MYDVRRAMDENGNLIINKKGRAVPESIAEVLKEQVPLIEKEDFATLNPDDPDYRKKYDAKIQYYYALQIKALQLM